MKRKIILAIGLLVIVALAVLFFKMFCLYRYETIALPGLMESQKPTLFVLRINRITNEVNWWNESEGKWGLFKIRWGPR